MYSALRLLQAIYYEVSHTQRTLIARVIVEYVWLQKKCTLLLRYRLRVKIRLDNRPTSV